ncbi:MAG: hypothetical protein JHC22_06170 [Thermoproteus sp.]|nr:hypothetical protein [Thermoproteus sp.]
MWWRYSPWGRGWGWMGGGPGCWLPSYDEWLDYHLRGAVWNMRGLAQFVRENAGRLDPQTREELARELEELVKHLRAK